ncbi:hypothetical protein ARMGADRAFT_1032691 [Armillaria gallica]|uniref:F-box domain-containing protein n=1 Tax=Armillaria gallica TaxID=47427 RepID=A0A2H3DLZ7_ARMGA|nr:hypothetical protein ARMGADRAFT_1032691 [Armillaria gallica]
MNATNTVLYLNAVVLSIPEPVLPPKVLNSQISEILRATRPFLDTDNDWILQNIEVLEQQFSVYDASLNRIDEVRSEVQRHRDAVHRSLAAYSSTLAPIRRLPGDILRAVFLEVQISQWWNRQELSGPSTEPPALDFSQGPWELSHVCGAWRDVILSYPQLWSRIALQFWTGRQAETLHLTLSALQAMILRSAQHPLDIAFDLEEHEDVATEVFPMILEESYRWRSMELHLSLPLLEQLKLVRGRIPSIFDYGNSVRPPRVRRGAARRYSNGPSNFIFPLHITHLATYMGNVSNVEVYQSLVECHLALPAIPDPNFSPPRLIHLPNVHRLFVSSPDILPWLRLPSLEDLMISNYPSFRSDTNPVVSMMNEFVYCSRCSLTRLAIHNPVSHNQVFIDDCLLTMDSLVYLEVGLFGDREVKVISDALASSAFLATLQHLSLYNQFTKSKPLFDQNIV